MEKLFYCAIVNDLIASREEEKEGNADGGESGPCAPLQSPALDKEARSHAPQAECILFYIVLLVGIVGKERRVFKRDHELPVVVDAVRHRGFWLLAGSFFVCGYTSTGLIGVHLIPHAVDHGFPKMAASSAMGLMGAMNVVGTTLSGYICDRYGKRVPLALYYFLRGLSLFFLPAVTDLTELNLFAIVFGLNYISTVPPTSMLTADLFGRRSVGMLFGWIFLAHQIGAGLASYVGGFVYDHTGTYDLAFLSAGVLGILAAGMVLAIREPGRAAPAPAVRSAPATGD